MKWNWARRDRRGAIALVPGECHWLIAEGPAAEPALVAGGTITLEGGVFPPPPEGIRQLLSDKRVRWAVVAPLAVRGAIATLPALPDADLAQGTRWEAEKMFHVGDLDPVYDFEILAPATEMSASAAHLGLLIAVRRSAVNHWQEWTQRLPHPLRGLEPAFSAAIRAFCHFAKLGDRRERSFAGVYSDAGSAAAAVFARGRPLALRNLSVRIPRDGDPLPLHGEEGIRNLRETLLACEDRHPFLAIDGLCGMGSVDRDWLAQAARACQTDVLAAAPPPAGVPESMAASGAWFLPFGSLLAHGN
ncbi:MAG: hypothetical protein L0Z55_12910 [Planctomycetes bacterium]|nr:hypothetical protein [Planctomycetota bacterium]